MTLFWELATGVKGRRSTLRRLVHGLRTEGAGPVREAAAVGVGVFVGCSPFYGFHLLLCLGLGTLFRLNRLKVYLAANVSNPLVAPFLVLAQVQTGAWLRRGSMHPITVDAVRKLDPWVFGQDLLVGSAVVGGVLAVCGAATTFFVVRVRSRDALFATLVQRASDRYSAESLAAWEFARGKLQGDPVYEAVLHDGVLPSGGTLVDVGCGQGLMLALLAEAADTYRGGGWPATRVPPPLFEHMVGIELRPRVAALAQTALGDRATIVEGDATALAAETCSAVLLFDVLHMMSSEDQARLLRRLGNALATDGVLLIREADAAAGWRFAIVRIVNALQALRTGGWQHGFQYRTQREWLAFFADCGFAASVCDQGGHPMLGNQLFAVARRTDSS